MYISARERRILEILLVAKEETTVKELARTLEVSERTVHRDLKGVEELINEFHLTLDKRSGVGIQVTGEEHNKEQVYLRVFNLSHTEYTPEERQTIILTALLEAHEPVKLISLASDLNVTVATISNDLDKVDNRLQSYELSLIRKRGYGVEITGSEAAKRRAMSSLLMENMDEYEFLALIKDTIQKKSTQTVNTMTERLLGLVDKKKLLIIEKQIEKMKSHLPYSLADSAYVGLIIHLTLAIERLTQGEKISFDEMYLKKIQHTKEFNIAEKIAKEMELVFDIDIPIGEVGYITMHLMGAKLRFDNDNLFEESSLQVAQIAQKLIRGVSEAVGQDLTGDKSLLKDLVIHLKPAIYRIKQNMRITNPLLEKIEQDYGQLFSTIDNQMELVFPDLVIPRGEVGYLVMHFGAALLRKGEQNELSALVICASGIGTAKILASKIKQEISGIKTIRNISVFDLAKVDPADYDLVISTISLQNHFIGKYELVSPILSPSEIEKLRVYVKEKGNRNNRIEPIVTKRSRWTTYQQGVRTISKLSSLQKYTGAILEILKFFSINESTASTVELVLKEACSQLLRSNKISDAELVVRHLLERERLGGIGITDSTLSLYHARSSAVLKPSFTIYKLSEPLPIKAMDDSLMETDTILLMLVSEDADDETMEVLSHISAMIIHDTDSLALFQSGRQEYVLSHLSTQLEQLLEEKLTNTQE